MKKRILLSILAVLSVATIANAEPRFGVVGYATDGASVGVIITDDMYNASLAVGNSKNDAVANAVDGGADAVTKGTNIDFSANYKMALDSATAGTIGIGFTTSTGEETGGNEVAKNQTISLRAGIERSLSSNLLLLADVTVFSQNTLELDTADADATTKTTSIFNGGRVGIAYLF